MIKRHQVSRAIHAADGSNEERVRHCSRCMDMFGVIARLGPRIMSLDDVTGRPMPKPLDYDHWFECRNCGTIYAKKETKIEPELETIKEPSTGKRSKIVGASAHNRKKKGRVGVTTPELKHGTT